MRIYVNGVQQGGSAGIPGTPAEVLLDAANQAKLVALATTTGVGEAVTYGSAVSKGVGQLAATLGDFSVGDGAGGSQLASVNPGAVRSVIGVSGTTVLRASDCTPENGGSSASITGVGELSEFTITASATANFYGSGGATSARILCPIPANAKYIEIEIGPITALSGFSGGRFLGVALRNAINGGAPSYLWGTSFCEVGSGSPKGYIGDLMGGANAGVTGINQSSASGLVAVNKWIRMSINPSWPLLGLSFGTGVAGARPVSWSPIITPTGIPSPYGTLGIADTSVETAVALYLQSFGGGGATSITARLSVSIS